jgi:hypothetical protein
MSRAGMLAPLVLLVAACATSQAPFDAHLRSEASQERDCAQWYLMLDARVAAAGVRDAQETMIAGFPYLRVNRLLSSLRPLARDNAAAFDALTDRMLSLDAEARGSEIRNLPAGALPGLSGARDSYGLREALKRTHDCGALLRKGDFATSGPREALLERAQVPDDYGNALRFFGVYALSRIPFASGVRKYEEETREAFHRELTQEGVVRYSPPPAELAMPRGRVALILERGAQNPLGIPEPTESELNELFLAYAPSFEVEVQADFDRFGALRYLRDSTVPVVDGAQLALYVQPAWTRYRNKVLLQLVYTLWFPERPVEAGSSLLAGKLDGLVWRVTLAPDGEPLLYDSIHPCGCYHQFFPTPRAAPLPAPDAYEEWAFSPQSLPRIAEGERPLVRLASGTHYIERVSVVHGIDSLSRYELRPYADLRSIFRLTGDRASAFGADGIIAGTERPERLLFWPMGIASAGAMRQWGRHATAFVGRRHFDDADLIEKRFRLELP